MNRARTMRTLCGIFFPSGDTFFSSLLFVLTEREREKLKMHKEIKKTVNVLELIDFFAVLARGRRGE